MSDQQTTRQERQELYREVDAFKALADDITTRSIASLLPRLDERLTFLTNYVLIRAQAEDQLLYPALARVVQLAALKEKVDHTALRRMTEELQVLRAALGARQPSRQDAQTLQHLLYGLHTLTRLHLELEDELVLPELGATLSPGGAQELMASVDRAILAIKKQR